MTQSRTSRSAALDDLVASTHTALPDLHGVMVASSDGLALAHNFPVVDDAERIAAMAAAAVVLGAQITDKATLGDLQEAVIRGVGGQLVVCPAGDSAVLVLSAPLDTNPGLIRLEARVAAVAVQQVLG